MSESPIIHSGIEKTHEGKVDAIYDMALTQHAALEKCSADTIKACIRGLLGEIHHLEESARRDRGLVHLRPETAKAIKAIWTFSGPGTYYEPIVRTHAYKDHAYRDFPWAQGMDRARLNYTARLARKVTEAITGVTHRAAPSTIREAVARTKGAMEQSGPLIIYNGISEENAAVEKVLSEAGTVVPANKVLLIGGDIKNTVDQVKTFALPEEIHEGIIALVSHAPHLARIIRMINTFKPLPSDMRVMLFPLPTPDEGRDEYAAREICGLIYYAFVSSLKEATPEPYPYTVYAG